MAKIKKSKETIEAVKKTQEEEHFVEETAEAKNKPVKANDKPTAKKSAELDANGIRTMLCHGTFTKVAVKDMCLTYADGKYSKAYLKKKNIPCPRKSK